MWFRSCDKKKSYLWVISAAHVDNPLMLHAKFGDVVPNYKKLFIRLQIRTGICTVLMGDAVAIGEGNKLIQLG